VGGVEAGGTKLVCAIGTGPDDIRAETHLANTGPAETLPRAVAFFTEHARRWPLAALGVATFGPVDLRLGSATFGFITTTPKQGWANVDVAGPFRRALGLPVGFDTDVNGAALAEHRWGAAQGLDTFVYLTVGTGIGGGALVNGRLLHGLVHPEMGHIPLPRDPHADAFAGACPYHGDCLEGLASGHAMRARWGVSPESLPVEHPAWSLEAHYLALGVASIVAVLSPRRVIVGGGVMAHAPLLARVRHAVRDALAGYLQAPALAGDLDDYIVPPALGARAGVLGALALGQAAATVPR
jgi:fructokinase